MKVCVRQNDDAIYAFCVNDDNKCTEIDCNDADFPFTDAKDGELYDITDGRYFKWIVHTSDLIGKLVKITHGKYYHIGVIEKIFPTINADEDALEFNVLVLEHEIWPINPLKTRLPHYCDTTQMNNNKVQWRPSKVGYFDGDGRYEEYPINVKMECLVTQEKDYKSVFMMCLKNLKISYLERKEVKTCKTNDRGWFGFTTDDKYFNSSQILVVDCEKFSTKHKPGFEYNMVKPGDIIYSKRNTNAGQKENSIVFIKSDDYPGLGNFIDFIKNAHHIYDEDELDYGVYIDIIKAYNDPLYHTTYSDWFKMKFLPFI